MLRPDWLDRLIVTAFYFFLLAIPVFTVYFKVKYGTWPGGTNVYKPSAQVSNG